MGLFWDLIQQSQISQQRSTTDSLDARVATLEAQLRDMQRIQLRLLQTLEEHFQRDLNDDGRVG